jgi:hypothetical protein
VKVGDLAVRVASRAADAAAAAHGVPGAGLIVESLLRDLLQLQDEQAQTLSRIERNVERLIEGPWRTAHLRVRESLLPGRSPEQVADYLNRASDELRQALGLQPDGFAGAYIAFDLAVLLAVLGDDEASRFYARESIRVASNEIIRLSDEIMAGVQMSVHQPVRGRVRRLQSALSRPEPRPSGREWYLLARAIEPLCGERCLIEEQQRMGFRFFIVRLAIDHDPVLRGLSRPPWLQDPGSLPPTGPRFS